MIRLWIDLDNSPHVPLFAPLIRHVRDEGWSVMLTARSFAQTLDLVEQHGLDALAVGEHAGRSKVRKVLNLPVRSSQLIRAVGTFRPQVALSHGSRTQTIAARILGVPSLVMFDYEWTEMSIFKRLATRLACPSIITDRRLEEAGIVPGRVERYGGYKEDLYLFDFRPDDSFRGSIGASRSDRLVTIRPPGLIGNYHDSRSEEICREVIARAAADPENLLVILPKTGLERELVRASLPERPAARVLVPERALPGLQLLYHSDVAVSGGGTMNREAALLGVPTYSMFTGRKAAIDEQLASEGALVFLEHPADVDRIDWNRTEEARGRYTRSPNVMYEVADLIRSFVDRYGSGRAGSARHSRSTDSNP